MPNDERQGRVAFSGAGRPRQARIDDEAVSIFGERMAEIGELRFLAATFAIEACIGVGC